MFNKALSCLLIFTLGTVLGYFSPTLLQGILDTKEDESKVEMKVLSKFLNDYYQVCGKFPEESVGLAALANPSIENCKAKAFFSAIPKDQWDNDYIYVKSDKTVLLVNSKHTVEYVFSSK